MMRCEMGEIFNPNMRRWICAALHWKIKRCCKGSSGNHAIMEHNKSLHNDMKHSSAAWNH